MCQLTDLQIKKILDILKESEISSYKISKDTGLTQSTLGNYRNGKSFPTQANALILKRYFGIDFADQFGNFSENSNSVFLGNNNTTGDIDNRQFYSDSPDVLRAHIDLLDERIKEKDAQIKEKDAQIKELLSIISKMSDKD